MLSRQKLLLASGKEGAQNMKITDAKSVASAPGPAPGQKQVIHYVDDVRGLGVRVAASGTRSWIFSYYSHRIERRLTIGRVEAWPMKLAIAEAHRLRRMVDLGEDPMAERHAERVAPTVSDLIERWREEKAPRKRPASLAEDEALIRQWIMPELGNVKVGDVTYGHIDRLLRKVTKAGTPTRANRVVALLSRLFSLAVIWQMRPDQTNPCKGIEKNAETKRHRYLKTEELPRLSAALDAHLNKASGDAIRLLLLTGARKGEVLSMKWTDLDLGKAPVWTKPAASTKQAEIHRVPLSAEACALLLAIQREAEEKAARTNRPVPAYVFPVQRKRGQPAIGQHLPDVRSSWEQICKAAGLEDLRIHDLRHSFASILASQGFSLPMIGALLGHSQAATTSRYAHLLDDAQRQATAKVGEVVRLRSTGK
jgi:integrase